MGRRREPRPGNRAGSQSWEKGTSFELARFVNSCGADLMGWARCVQPFSRRSETGADPVSLSTVVKISSFFLLFLPGKVKRPSFAALDRPSTWRRADLSLLFFFWRLRNAIDGRAPGGLLGLSWQKEVAGRRSRRRLVRDRFGHVALAGWRKSLGTDRDQGGPGCSRPPPVIFPGCPSGAVDNSGRTALGRPAGRGVHF